MSLIIITPNLLLLLNSFSHWNHSQPVSQSGILFDSVLPLPTSSQAPRSSLLRRNRSCTLPLSPSPLPSLQYCSLSSPTWAEPQLFLGSTRFHPSSSSPGHSKVQNACGRVTGRQTPSMQDSNNSKHGVRIRMERFLCARHQFIHILLP